MTEICFSYIICLKDVSNIWKSIPSLKFCETLCSTKKQNVKSYRINIWNKGSFLILFCKISLTWRCLLKLELALTEHDTFFPQCLQLASRLPSFPREIIHKTFWRHDVTIEIREQCANVALMWIEEGFII